jgi:hypothetical protein
MLLPFALAGLLERRYLDGFRPEAWNVVPPEETALHRPLLREVARLGRPSGGMVLHQLMPGLLATCHEPGHALVLLLHGGAERMRLWLGTRRLPGARQATADHLEMVTGAFSAVLPGLDLASPGSPTADVGAEPASLLDRAPCFAALTGIPTAAGPGSAIGLERLAEVRCQGDFLLQILAEPLDPWVLDGTLDALRRLRGEVHGLVRRTHSRAETTTTGHSTPDTPAATALGRDDLPLLLVALSGILQVAGLLPDMGRLAQLAGPLQSMALFGNARELARMRSSVGQHSESRGLTAGTTVEEIDVSAEAAEQILLRSIERLESIRSGGWWRAAVYLAAENEADLRRLAGALKGPIAGAAGRIDPIRVLRPAADTVRDAMRYGRFLTLSPREGDERDGLAALGLSGGFDGLVTCLGGPELAAWLALPQRELPGLPLRERPNFAVAVPPRDADDLVLGRLPESLGRGSAVPIAAATLNRNVLVAGIVGSGKTNTCMHLLLEAHARWKVPFLVLEPVKTEYRALAGDPRLAEPLHVYTAGIDAHGLPLRLNPLEPAPRFPVARHLDMLKAVFNASFPMFAGMSYVLEEALVEVYEDHGWSLRGGPEPVREVVRDEAERAALWPDLRALHDKIELVLKRKGYGAEIHANLGAALRSRIASLTVGQKGVLLDTRRSIPLASLFERPCVVELQPLGDDEEKAFVMALLFVLLCEHAELRQSDLPPAHRGRLQHLTLIEEAHRLLAVSRGLGGAESADPRGKAVGMFTDLLAELRAYGEGFVIADQIPTKLAPETAKNTALKIVHRLTSVDDRHAMGGCCDLTPEQTRALNTLPPGRAVVHDQRLGEAVLVEVERVGVKNAAGGRPSADTALDRSYLRHGGGCALCAEPCQHRRGLDGSSLLTAAGVRLGRLLDSLLWSTPEGLLQPAARLAGSVWRRDEPSGRVYCALLDVARGWLSSTFEARHAAVGGRGLRAIDRILTERALTALGPLLRSLADGTEPRAEELATSASALQGIVAGRPPRLRPGCDTCPDPCRALPLAASAARKLGPELLPLVTSPLDVGLRATSFLTRAEAAFVPPAGVAEPDRLRAGWLHCVIVQMVGEEGDDIAVMELLRQLAQTCAGTRTPRAAERPRCDGDRSG